MRQEKWVKWDHEHLQWGFPHSQLKPPDTPNLSRKPKSKLFSSFLLTPCKSQIKQTTSHHKRLTWKPEVAGWSPRVLIAKALSAGYDYKPDHLLGPFPYALRVHPLRSVILWFHGNFYCPLADQRWILPSNLTGQFTDVLRMTSGWSAAAQHRSRRQCWRVSSFGTWVTPKTRENPGLWPRVFCSYFIDVLPLFLTWDHKKAGPPRVHFTRLPSAQSNFP